MKAIVYWIHYKDHTDPYSQGYVGVTVDFERRIKSHINEAKNGIHSNEFLRQHLTHNDIQIDILHIDEELVCYELERKYRPELNIGWNISKGGGEGGVIRTGYKLSEEFREKRKLAMIGNKIAAVNKGKPKSEEHRKKIGNALKHKPKSIEHKRKQSDAMKEVHKKKREMKNVAL